jgi:C1A family cysteine protease
MNMKKSRNNFSELLVIFLLVLLTIAIAGVEYSEQNGTLGIDGGAINHNKNSANLELAPENPGFVKQHNNNFFNQDVPSKNGSKTGYVPAPVDLDHLNNISTAGVSTQGYYSLHEPQALNGIPSNKARLSAPASYDLRTLDKVTSVKDQGMAGTCWAFATYSSLESYLKPGENRDYSENNMKNLLSSSYPEGFDRSAA